VHVDTVPIPNDPHGQTRSRFGKHKDTDVIIFHNDDARFTLEIGIVSDPNNPNNEPVLCEDKKGKVPVTPMPTHVGVGQTGEYTICQAFKGADFKYTATIGSAKTEDPIIIIENSKASFTLGVVGIVIVAAIGATIGAIVANYFAARRLARLRRD